MIVPMQGELTGRVIEGQVDVLIFASEDIPNEVTVCVKECVYGEIVNVMGSDRYRTEHGETLYTRDVPVSPEEWALALQADRWVLCTTDDPWGEVYTLPGPLKAYVDDAINWWHDRINS